MSGGNRRKSSLFYVRQRTSERAETAAGQGDGPTGERLGGGSGYCVLCAGFAMMVTGEVMC